MKPTVAFLAAFKIEVSLVVVAAFLTMVGYSLNDTIIIFDRVRENLRKHKKMSFEDILNLSVNETLPRSILTHGTTLVTLLALIVFGIVAIFVNIPNSALIYAIVGLVIFAGFTMYDFQRLRKTKDIRAAPLLAASIFLDVLNVFLLLLSLLNRR